MIEPDHSNHLPPPPPRRPWPMKWIVFAVLIYALLQTFYLFITTR
jgi:hypothetical protein